MAENTCKKQDKIQLILLDFVIPATLWGSQEQVVSTGFLLLWSPQLAHLQNEVPFDMASDTGLEVLS